MWEFWNAIKRYTTRYSFKRNENYSYWHWKYFGHINWNKKYEWAQINYKVGKFCKQLHNYEKSWQIKIKKK